MLLLSYIRWAKDRSKLPAENNDPKFLLDATLIAKHFLNHELRLQYSLISYISKWNLWVSLFFFACWQITWKVKYRIILFRAVPRRLHKIMWQAHSLPVSYSHAENSMEWIKANPLVQSNPLKSRTYYCTSVLAYRKIFIRGKWLRKVELGNFFCKIELLYLVWSDVKWKY